MSSSWETQYRLLHENLADLADGLSSERQIAPAVLKDHTVRLLAGLVMSLRQHEVNKNGQCRYCSRLITMWRFWRRRPRCTIYRNLSFALSQGSDEVWWQLFDSLGRRTSLDEVRKWVAERERAIRTSSSG